MARGLSEYCRVFRNGRMQTIHKSQLGCRNKVLSTDKVRQLDGWAAVPQHTREAIATKAWGCKIIDRR